jgi:hypothetical protein
MTTPSVPDDLVRAQVAGMLSSTTRPDDGPSPLVADLTVRWVLSMPPEDRWGALTGLESWLAFNPRPQSAQTLQVRLWAESMNAGPARGLVRRLASTTITRHIAAVAAWYQFLLAHGACDHNPAAEVTHQRRNRHREWIPAPGAAASAALVTQSLELAEQRQTETAWRDCALASLLFYTALEPATLIQARAIDLIGLTDPDGPLTLWTGPHGQADSFQQLPEPTNGPLRAYLLARATRRCLHRSQLDGPLIARTQGSALYGDYPLKLWDVKTVLNTLLDATGICASTTITVDPFPLAWPQL